jgi:AraC-like DNA-binding protein
MASPTPLTDSIAGVVTRPPLPNWQALLTPVVTNTFDELEIAVAFWLGGDFWQPIHVAPNIVRAETEHGAEQHRWRYNHKNFAIVERDRRVVRGEHRGFHDLFVPIQDSKGVRSVLVAGPILRHRPTSAEVLERWYELTRSQGRLGDPSFGEYLAMTLASLTLEGPLFAKFEQLLLHFAHLVEGRAVSEELTRRIEALHHDLLEARMPEKSWSEVRSMVGERSGRMWSTRDATDSLNFLGLERTPQHVMVGLLANRPGEVDPIDAFLRRDAFQRACVTFARRQGKMACGRVGDHGVVILIDHQGPSGRTRARLTDLAARLAAMAKRFGLDLHAGAGAPGDASGLAARYRAGLWAAEKALTRGLPLVYGEPRPERSASRLRKLRAALSDGVAERPELLSPRFDRYVEAVLTHSGYRVEDARGHLQAGLERLAEPLLASGALDEKSFDDLYASMERAAEDAHTVVTLVESYRHAIAGIETALESPTSARQDRGTQRAVTFLREHSGEPVTRDQAARVAGFAPDYFSRIFKRDVGSTFEEYLLELRMGRAKQMLGGTSLAVERVGQMCGFRSRSYFHRMFKKRVGTTPVAFRSRGRWGSS